MTSNAQRIIDLIQGLRSAPDWTAHKVAVLLKVELRRDPKAPSNAKVYVSSDDGLFPSARFWQPIFGISKSALLQLDVRWEQQISEADLSSLIPAGAPRRMHPPPAPGSKGPSRMGFSLSAVSASANVGLAFESRDKSKPYLFGINVKRELPPFSSQDWALAAFRAYAVQSGDALSYTIDWQATGSPAITVTDLSLVNRKLSLSFVAVEPRIGEILARELIRELLLRGLLREQLLGNYDQVTYRASELDSSVTEIPEQP